MKSLHGRSVVITGASSGIGRAAAIAFAKRGANLVLAARRVEKLEEVKREVEALGVKALVVPTDVTDPAQVQRLIDASIEHYGKIDVLINNAGVGMMGAFNETPIEEIREVFEVDFFSVVQMMRAALVAMERDEEGVIVNIASTAGLMPSPYISAYNAAKAALVMLSESVNVEYMGSRIHIVAYCPHITESSFQEAKRTSGRYRNWIRFGSVVTAEAVAEDIVRAVLRPRPLVIHGLLSRVSWKVRALAPWLYYPVVRRFRDRLREANPISEDRSS